MKAHEIYWKKLGLPDKLDLLVKYYPNPKKRWSITDAMMKHIYNSEITNDEKK